MLGQAWDAMLYDAAFPLPGYPRWEAEVYAALAQARPGPVLELGAGTARLMIPLLRQGIDVYGIDNDEAMFESGQAKLGRALGDKAAARLMLADARTMALATRFATIVLPYNTLPLIPLADRPVLFERVRAHLQPGGAFVFDIVLPWSLTPEQLRQEAEVAVGGVLAKLTIDTRFDPHSGCCQLDRSFMFPDGSCEQRRLELHYQPLEPQRRLLEAAGFGFEVEVDERGQAVGSQSRLYLARVGIA